MKHGLETSVEWTTGKGIDVFPCETQIEIDIIMLFTKAPERPGADLRQIRDDI